MGIKDKISQRRISPLTHETMLSPAQEKKYKVFAALQELDPESRGMKGDYDMRGFYQGLMNNDPRAITAPDPSDNYRMHYTDTWKKPTHETFSNESMYATPMDFGGIWRGYDRIPQNEISPQEYLRIITELAKRRGQ